MKNNISINEETERIKALFHLLRGFNLNKIM